MPLCVTVTPDVGLAALLKVEVPDPAVCDHCPVAGAVTAVAAKVAVKPQMALWSGPALEVGTINVTLTWSLDVQTPLVTVHWNV